MRLYIEGHHGKQGYIIAREWSDEESSKLPPATAAELRPVRFIGNGAKAKKLVARWNSRFATH